MSPTFFDWSLADLPDQHGRRAVVTGASSGLGTVMARELARVGAEVIMAVRDTTKAERVAARIRQEHQHARLVVRQVDTAELTSARAFTRKLHDEDQAIDILVLNAGVTGDGRAVTSDGIEHTFATNVVGHFAMARDLVTLLERGTDPRIVWVGSNYYRRLSVELDPADLSFPKPTPNIKRYTRSKLANLLVALELDRRLWASSSPVRSLIAHPGVAATAMQNSARGPAERVVSTLVTRLLARDADDGATPLLFAAVAEQAPRGLFIGRHLRRADQRIWADSIVGAGRDRDLAARLYQRLEEVTAPAELNT